LIRSGEHALILECKYSSNPEVVARDGYYQITTYATEIRSRLVGTVAAVVVGPEGVIPHPGWTQTLVGEVGTSPPSGLQNLVQSFLKKTNTLPTPEERMAKWLNT
jgi:hypothetical protein